MNGYLAYYSPETLLGVEHTKKTDVWSVGIYFAALLLGSDPILWVQICEGVHPVHIIEKVIVKCYFLWVFRSLVFYQIVYVMCAVFTRRTARLKKWSVRSRVTVLCEISF